MDFVVAIHGRGKFSRGGPQAFSAFSSLFVSFRLFLPKMGGRRVLAFPGGQTLQEVVQTPCPPPPAPPGPVPMYGGRSNSRFLRFLCCFYSSAEIEGWYDNRTLKAKIEARHAKFQAFTFTCSQSLTRCQNNYFIK
jgi:hypothetical protein